MKQVLWTAAVGLLIALVFAWFTFSKSKASKSKPTVLLVGPSGAGKTALFTRWTSPDSADPCNTVTSTLPNLNTHTAFPMSGGDENVAVSISLMDLPGHEKLEHLTVDRLKTTANLLAVIFVLDAAAGQTNIARAAQRLYKILLQTEPRGIDVLIAANKADLFNTLSVAKITGILETEIDSIRSSQQKTIGRAGKDDDDEDTPFIGLESQFKFTDLESRVAVVAGSVKGNRLQKWDAWLES